MSKEKKSALRVVACPRCRKSTRYDSTNEFRPFCSAVCKNEDIIGWAQGDFRVAGEPVDPEVGPMQGEDDEG